MPEDDLPDVQPQLNAGTPLEVFAYDRANVKRLATGRLMALDSQIDTTTGTVKVRAQFDNADSALFPNQFVNAQLLVKTLHDVVTVPTAAIQRGAPGTYVYVINAGQHRDGAADQDRPDRRTRWSAIKSGLSVGDRVVVDGTDRLRDGARVIVPGARGAARQIRGESATARPGAPQVRQRRRSAPCRGGQHRRFRGLRRTPAARGRRRVRGSDMKR